MLSMLSMLSVQLPLCSPREALALFTCNIPPEAFAHQVIPHAEFPWLVISLLQLLDADVCIALDHLCMEIFTRNSKTKILEVSYTVCRSCKICRKLPIRNLAVTFDPQLQFGQTTISKQSQQDDLPIWALGDTLQAQHTLPTLRLQLIASTTFKFGPEDLRNWGRRRLCLARLHLLWYHVRFRGTCTCAVCSLSLRRTHTHTSSLDTEIEARTLFCVCF